ncbi:MAG: hypothetical protein AAGJ35_08355, partial [Myxococcota bacterium]
MSVQDKIMQVWREAVETGDDILDLSYCEIGDEGALFLAEQKLVLGMKVLSLRENDIGAEGLL